MDTKLSRVADGLLQASWLIAVIAVPLFFNIHSERVFEPDKLTLLRSIALFMLAVWLVRFVDQKGWQQWRRLRWRTDDSIWREPFVLPLVALIVVYLVSTALSVTPRVSWAGSYQRLQGTYTTLSYIVVFGTMITTLRSRAAVRRVVTAIIIASIPVAFYGLLQHFGLDPLPWGGDVTVRVAGHMGNAIFIAAYLIMAVPLTLARIFDAFTSILSDERVAAADIVRAAVYIFVVAIQLLTIYWTGSRGPLIGLAVGLFSFILVLLVSLRGAAGDARSLRPQDVLYALLLVLPSIVVLLLANAFGNLFSPLAAFAIFFGVVILSVLATFLLIAVPRAWRWLWLSWLALTVFVAGWLLLFNIPADRLAAAEDFPLTGGVASTLVEWKELPAVGTYGRMLDPTQTAGREKSNRVRVLIWQGVVDLIRPHEPISFADGRADVFNFWRPLIGYGPESMYVAYNRFYPPELATVEARNASPDRAHNETFDALVISGFFGFLAWQALYLTAFYYGFKYLGVVRRRRDRNMLVGLWIAGALAGAAISLLVVEPIYLGVAIPTGTIVGLVAYLIYYAASSSGQAPAVDDEGSRRAVPFQTRRLLMNALVAAVLAHYVEIHFGIAISATRLHFFVYLALMYTISRGLVRTTEPIPGQATAGRRGLGRTGADATDGWWRPALAWTFLLALMLGILGSEFINFVLPPELSIQTGADLTAGEIFRQSLFVNSQRNFMDSPFIFLMISIAWVLGVVLVVSELIKHEEVPVKLPQLIPVATQRRYLAAGAFVMCALTGVVLRFGLTAGSSASATLGRSLAVLVSIVCLWAAVRLVLNASGARRLALIVAAAGLVLLLPLGVAGAWFYAAIVAVLSLLVLYLLWDKAYRSFLVPPMVMAVAALAIGLAYAYLQAVLVREALLYLLFYQGIEPVSTLFSLFFRPDQVPGSVLELRVLEAQQVLRYISVFYLFLFSMIIASGLALAWPRWQHERRRGHLRGYATAAIVLIVVTVAITQTNLRSVQADMLYKRGRPFDIQASTTGDPLAWDVAIAIYEKAIELTPWEDYYYLFLGRALLERSGLAADAAEQTALLREAEIRLRAAQEINPLNVDHTANLARLNTRSIVTAPDDVLRTERLRAAERYYQEALALSPQNSVIRNEYARLILDLREDCAQSVEIYNESLAIDPFYRATYFALADALVQCAAMQPETTAQTAMYSAAVDSLSAGLQIDPESAPAWLQAAQLYQRLGLADQALAAIDSARAYDAGGRLATWNVDFLEAQIYQQLGEASLARALAEQALASAPPDVVTQIEQFLATLPQG